jgi:predicted secreted protein with PEFG-CTERM motif
MKRLFIFSILAVALISPLVLDESFAQKNHVINIPTGAADINAPYFWQVEETGNTDGVITIPPLDTVTWKNADTAAHTVTSGTVENGPDGIFDSSLFGPGKDFRHQFTEQGNYDYFCLVHPWMVGTIKVVFGTEDIVHILHGVASELDSEGGGFDLNYKLDRKIQSAIVDPNRSTITFTLTGFGQADELIIDLPEKLITNPASVWVDNTQITNFDSESTKDGTRLTIPLEETSEEVIVMGTAVIPEFGSIVSIILAIAIISTFVITTKTQKLSIPKL